MDDTKTNDKEAAAPPADAAPADSSQPAASADSGPTAAPAEDAAGKAAPRSRNNRPRPGRGRYRKSGGRSQKSPAAKESGKEDEPIRLAGNQDGETAAPEAKAESRKPQAKSGGRKSPGPQKGKSRQTKTGGAEKPKAAGSGRSPRGKAAPKAKVQSKLLINRDEPEEGRIVLLEDGRVESFHVETVLHTQTRGNIYKGRITTVEPNLQAVFVDIGTERNGFLPFGDIHPDYYGKDVDPDIHWKKLNIQDLLRKGQEVLVQVEKEATGNKGASMTTFLSLPGRYMVLMPGSDTAGISRKIEGESQRKKLREMIDSLELPEGVGYIVRTASKDITKTALSQDMRYLVNLWQETKKRGQSMAAPALIYEEQDIFARFLRDHFTPDIQEILVDNEEAHKQIMKFMELLPDSQKTTKIGLYKGSRPIFNQYNVEEQIEQIYQPTVKLPSGGSIVINPTEALVAIDVNSGRTSKDKDFEESIFLANMEAAEELTRQLRLRDLGGLIVVDFIDMRDSRHIREVEKKVKNCMKRDKAKVDISRISKFGLLQISRQKLASPVQRGIYRVCEHCQGRGMVRSVETLALVYLRRIQTGVTRKNVARVSCRLPIEVAQYLLNKKRQDLLEMEKRYKVTIFIEADPEMPPSEGDIEFIREERAAQQ